MIEYWVWLTLASSFFITFQRIIQKKVLNHEHASEYLTTFCLLMWIFLLPLVFIYGLDFNGWALFLIFCKSIFFSVSSLYVVRANRHLELSTVEPLKDLGPLFVLVLAMVFLGEIPTFKHLIGFFLLVAGTFLLRFGTWTPHLKNPLALFKQKHLHYLFLALIIGGFSVLFDKWIVRDVSTLTTLFFLFLFTSVFLLLHQQIVYKGIHDVKKALVTHGGLISVIVLVSLISDWLYFVAVAIPHAPLSLIVPLRKVSVIFVVLLGGELFHEKHLKTKFIASLILLIGVYFIAS